MKHGEAAVGIDVGGTNTKVAMVSARGKLLEMEEIPTRSQEGPALFVRRVCRVVAGWKGRGPRLCGAGLGLAGDVDSEKGSLRFTPNLKGWDGFKFKSAFERGLGLPVVVDNDANLAVWGAYVLELKRQYRNVAGLTLGTGVGGGIILDGRLYRGATGSAAEVGHLCVEPGGAKCHCGQRGCLEAYAGSYGILRTARGLLARGGSSILSRRKGLTPLHISQAAEQGDALARKVWALTAERLACGIADIVFTVNPEAVILLGGVSRAGKWLMEPLRRELWKKPFKTPFHSLVLRAADYHNGGCLGAALIALER
ncbi:MAG: ROK family protein [Elusimicrobia bacterium]|nr:ROK family protein [Elusimicrobiota bacterium]